MQNICVYQHRRADTGEVFYIGKGALKRAHDQKRRNPHWKSIVAKHGYSAEIICSGLDDKHACDLEVMLIGFHGRRDISTGTLVNMTDGGDGVRGRVMPKHTPETRAKMSAWHKGRKKSPEQIEKVRLAVTGHIKSDETRAKLSRALKGRKHSAEHVAKRAEAIRGEKSPMWGTKMPQDTRDKISASLKGRDLGSDWGDRVSSATRGIAKKGSASPYCGVGRYDDRRWVAKITNPDRKLVHLGLFLDQEDAARAYDAASLRMYGAAARLNFPQPE